MPKSWDERHSADMMRRANENAGKHVRQATKALAKLSKKRRKGKRVQAALKRAQKAVKNIRRASYVSPEDRRRPYRIA